MTVTLVFRKGGKGSGFYGHTGLPGVHGGSRARGSGFVTVFHGTQDELIESIKQFGIIKGKKSSFGRPPANFFVENELDAFLTGKTMLSFDSRSRYSPQSFIELAADRNFAVIEVHLPKEFYDAHRQVDDHHNIDFNTLTAGYITRNFPPEWIKAIRVYGVNEIQRPNDAGYDLSKPKLLSEWVRKQLEEETVTVYVLALIVPKEIKREKGGPDSGHHGHGGLKGVHGGSSSSGKGTTKAPAKKTSRVWAGSQQEKAQKRLSKLATGALGERLAIKAAEKKVGAKFATFNTNINNSPIDIAGDHHAIEVKTGLASNGKSAQHWRATIGEPGKAEKALLKQMDSKQKRAHNTWKRSEILRRKNDAVKEMSRIAGEPIKGATIGLILSPDGKRADVYFIPGFHQRMAWNKYATDEYYVGTYDA